MNTGSYIVYKINPNEWDRLGESTGHVDGRLFLNRIIELMGDLIIFRELETNKIEGVFSSTAFYVLKYEDY